MFNQLYHIQSQILSFPSDIQNNEERKVLLVQLVQLKLGQVVQLKLVQLLQLELVQLVHIEYVIFII